MSTVVDSHQVSCNTGNQLAHFIPSSESNEDPLQIYPTQKCTIHHLPNKFLVKTHQVSLINIPSPRAGPYSVPTPNSTIHNGLNSKVIQFRGCGGQDRVQQMIKEEPQMVPRLGNTPTSVSNQHEGPGNDQTGEEASAQQNGSKKVQVT